jgi:hypothetical protein
MDSLSLYVSSAYLMLKQKSSRVNYDTVQQSSSMPNAAKRNDRLAKPQIIIFLCLSDQDK